MPIGLQIVALGACAALVDLGPERELALARADGGGGTGGEGGGAGGAGGSAGPCADSGVVRWAKTWGDAFAQVGTAVVSDRAGGAYIAGLFQGTLEFDVELAGAGAEDLFLARLDEDGNALWSRSFGDDLPQATAPVLEPMPDGGVVMAREIAGVVDFGGGPVGAVEIDGYVVRYAPDGTHLWTRMFTGIDQQNVWDVAVDPTTGDIIATGTFRSELVVGEEQRTSVGVGDVFVARLDADDGAPIALHAFGGASWDYANAVTVDASGRIYFGGETQSSFDLGDPLVAEGDPAAFVAQLMPDGTPVWSRQLGGAGVQIVNLLAMNAAHTQVTAAVVLDGTADFGDGPITMNGSGVLVRLDAEDGTPSGSAAFDGFRSPRSLVIDGDDGVYLSGPFTRTLEIGGAVIPNVGAQDGLLLKLDANLEVAWRLPVSTPDNDNLLGVALDTSGDVYVLGYFNGMLELPGCEPVRSSGEDDVILMKLAP